MAARTLAEASSESLIWKSGLCFCRLLRTILSDFLPWLTFSSSLSCLTYQVRLTPAGVIEGRLPGFETGEAQAMLSSNDSRTTAFSAWVRASAAKRQVKQIKTAETRRTQKGTTPDNLCVHRVSAVVFRCGEPEQICATRAHE